jgi:hypothetical protein
MLSLSRRASSEDCGTAEVCVPVSRGLEKGSRRCSVCGGGTAAEAWVKLKKNLLNAVAEPMYGSGREGVATLASAVWCW